MINMQSSNNGMIIFGSARSGTTVLATTVSKILDNRMINGLQPRSVDEIFNPWRIYDQDWKSRDWANSFGSTTVSMYDNLHQAIVTPRLHRMLDDIETCTIWPIIKLHSQELLKQLMLPTVLKLLRHPNLYKIMIMRRDIRNMFASKILQNITSVAHIMDDQNVDAYTDILNNLRQHPIEINEDVMQWFLHDIIVHIQYYISNGHVFDQIIWYDQLLSQCYSVPSLDISTDEISITMNRDIKNRKMHSDASDILRQCVTNWDKFEESCSIIDRIMYQVDELTHKRHLST